MGKKKSFIDKKSSSKYHLLYRSQRDVGGDDEERESGVVLWPNPENNPEMNDKVLKSGNKNANMSSSMNRLEQNLNQIGLVEDDYDYEKHMKPITGSGDYFEGGHRGNALVDPRARIFDDADDDDHVREVERQLDSIALTPDCMDEDIAQALFGDFEEGNFEEILDDFCITAAEEPEEEEGKDQDDFDYDAHIQQLIANSNKRKVERGIESKHHEWGREDDAFFSKLKPLHERNDDYDYDEDVETSTPGVVPKLSPDEEKALCEKFEQTLLEYDSDDYGELDDEDQELRGMRNVENDKLVEAALDDYLGEKKDDIFIEGTAHLNQRTGGSAFHTLRAGVEAEPENIKEVLADAQDFLRGPEMGVPPEEILIDGKSYFSERQRNPWDVESVLSTYSNLDNNPVTIESSSRRRKKKNKKKLSEQLAIDEEKEETNPIQIRLSNKTGLPLGVLPTKETEDYFDYDTIASVNKGIKRDKNETASEKRLRKQQVKQERFMARIQKKMMKEAFSEEFMKAFMGNDELAGKSVYRIT